MKYLRTAGAVICTYLLAHMLTTSAEGHPPPVDQCHRTIPISSTQIVPLPTNCPKIKWQIIKQTNYPEATSLRAHFSSLTLATPQAFIVITDERTSKSWIFSQQSSVSEGIHIFDSRKHSQSLIDGWAVYGVLVPQNQDFTSQIWYFWGTRTPNLRDYIVTSGNLTLTADIPLETPTTFTLVLSVQRFGEGLTPKDSIDFKQNAPLWKQTNDTYWTILAEESSQIVLTWDPKTKLTGTSEIFIYDGLMEGKERIAHFTPKASVSQVFSLSTQMLVVAKNFSYGSNLHADIHQKPTGTDVRSYGNSALFTVFAPIVEETRTWIINETSDAIVSLTINQAQSINGSQVHFYKSQSNEAIYRFLTLNTSLPSARTLFLHSRNGLRIDYVAPSSVVSPSILFSASYDTFSNCGESRSISDGSQTWTSPGYPNVYSFGSVCEWTFTADAKNLVHVEFVDMDLENDHSLAIDAFDEDIHSLSYAFQGDKAPTNLIFQASTVKLTLNTSEFSHFNEIAHKGFNLRSNIFACGDNFTVTQKKFSIPGPVLKTEAYSCLWYIEVPRKLLNEVNNINLTIWSNNPKANGSELKLYDGDHVGGEITALDFVNGSVSLLSRSHRIFISYTFDANTHTTYTAQFYSVDCPSQHQCHNRKLCMQDKWKCNGINDCGDWSDEMDCLKVCNTTTVNGSLTFAVTDGESPSECNRLFQAAHSDSILVARLVNLEFRHPLDSLNFMDGSNKSEMMFVVNHQNLADSEGTIIITNTSSLWVNSLSFNLKSVFTWTLNISEHKGGHLYSASNNITIPSLGKDTAFFALQAKDANHQVQIQSFKWLKSPIPSSEVCFYDGFTTDQTPLAIFHSTDVPFDVFSMTDKLLVVATNFSEASASMSFISIPSGTHVQSNGKSGSFHVTGSSINKTSTWLLNIQNTNVALTFSELNLNSGSELKVYKGLAYNHPPFLTLNSTLLSARTLFMYVHSGLRVDYVSRSSNSSQQTLFSSYYDSVPGCVQEYHLKDGQSIPLLSPGYPNVYPYYSNCDWELTMDSPKLVYIKFIDMDLDDEHTLTIAASSLNLTVNGKEPVNDLVFEASKVNLKLITSDLTKFRNSPRKGFSLNVTILAYGENFINPSGKFNITGASSGEYGVLGLWSIGGPQEQKVSYVEVTLHSSNKEAKGTELSLFDGPNVESSAKVDGLKFTNGVAKLSTKHNRLFIFYTVDRKSNTSAEYVADYSLHDCDIAHQCRSVKICMHEDWMCSGVNECGDGSDEIGCLNTTDFGKQTVNNFFVLTPVPSNDSFPQERKWKFEAAHKESILVARLVKVNFQHPLDSLSFVDGSESLRVISQQNQVGSTANIIVSNTSSLGINFFTVKSGSNWMLNISEHKGGHYFSAGDHIIIPPLGNDSAILALQAKDTKHQVQIQNFAWIKSALPSSVVCFYDGFSTDQPPLAIFRSTDVPFDVFSMTDKMLVVADNFSEASVSMSFISTPVELNVLSSGKSGAFHVAGLISNDTRSWLLNVHNTNVALTFNELNLGSGSKLKVYKGLAYNHPPFLVLNSSLRSAHTLFMYIHSGLRVDYVPPSNNSSEQTVFSAYYDSVPSCMQEFRLKDGQSIPLLSPGYPNVYPYNSNCDWELTVDSPKLIYIKFIDMDLDDEHTLAITSSSLNLTVNGKEPVNDLVFEASKVNLKLITSDLTKFSDSPRKGFSLNITVLALGKSFVSPSANFKIPGSSHIKAGVSGLWRIGYPKEENKVSNIEVTFHRNKETKGNELTLFDGPNVEESAKVADLKFKDGVAKLTTRHSHLFIFYAADQTSNVTTEYTVNYSIHDCNIAHQCHSVKICMHEDWICSGVNECGDGSDEFGCLNTTDYGIMTVNNSFILTSPVGSNNNLPQEFKWEFQTSMTSNSLVITFLNMDFNRPMDSLIFRDSSPTSDPVLTINRQNYKSAAPVIVSNSSLWVSFFSLTSQNGSSWELNITEHSVGGFYSGRQPLNITKSTNGKTFFALQTKDVHHQVLIEHFSWGKSIPSSAVTFYEGFSLQTQLARFQPDSGQGPFNVFSMTDKMLVVADNFDDKSYAAMSFSSMPSGHNFIDQSDSSALRLPLEHSGVTVWLINPVQIVETDAIIVLTLDSVNLSPTGTVVVQKGLEESSHPLITFPSTVTTPQTVHVLAKHGARVTVNNTHSDDSTSLFYVQDAHNITTMMDAHYDVMPAFRWSINLTQSGKSVKVMSPQYPNLYPLNAECFWTIAHAGLPVLITFDDIDLQPGHELQIIEVMNGTKSQTLFAFGKNLPDDILLQGDMVQISWSSSRNDSMVSGKGFNLTIRTLDCGSQPPFETGTFSSPELLNKSMECVWIISSVKHFTNETNVNFTMTTINQPMLRIHDGGSLRDAVIPYPSLSMPSFSMLSDYGKLLFHFKYVHETESQPSPQLTVTYAIVVCTRFCNNSRCMHEEWLCDGFNNCGDGSDELNCTACSASATTPPASSSGVSPGWLAGGVIMALVVGLALGVLGPIAYRKLRSRKNGDGYQRFDASVNNL